MKSFNQELKDELVEEIIKEFERRMPLITSHGLLLEARLTPTNYQKMKDWLRTTHHHQLQKARDRERWRCAGIIANYEIANPDHDNDVKWNDLLLDIKDDINDPEQWPIDDDGKFVYHSELDQPHA